MGAGRGRPSKYKPEYGPRLLEGMANGQSMTQMAVRFGVSATCFDDWAEKFPEFAEYFELARDAGQAFYETRLHDLVLDPELKSSAPVKAIEFLLASRFRKSYAKTSTTTQEITVNHVAKLSDKQLDAQIQRLLPNSNMINLDDLAVDGELVEDE